MPAKPWQIVRFNFFKLLIERPPSAMSGFLVKRDSNLNLLTPK